MNTLLIITAAIILLLIGGGFLGYLHIGSTESICNAGCKIVQDQTSILNDTNGTSLLVINNKMVCNGTG